MAYVYAQPGPPFDFNGNFSETQKDALADWVDDRSANFPAIQLHHQIRAQQLRKAAGLLEAVNAASTLDELAPSFQKDAWKPGPNGHWAYAYRNDHIPAQVMANLKRNFRYQMERMDEAVFHMNHLRAQIELQEDKAQYASDAPALVTALLSRIETLFSQAEYQAALVRDETDQYEGEPRFRVNQLDQPTAWEKDQNNHGM